MEESRKKVSGTAIILLCSIVYFVSYFARKDFAAVLVSMKAQNIIDNEMGGFIGMGLFIAYGVGQLVSGYLGDRIKPKTLIIFGLATTALCNFLMPLIPNGALMIPVWTLNGFAQAMLWPPIVRILADTLDGERFVTANLIVTAAAHISTILLYVYAPIAITYMDWQTVFYTASAVTLAVMIIFIVAMAKVTLSAPGERNAPPVSQNNDEGRHFISLFVKAGIIPIFFAIIMMGFLRDGIETWLPTLYSEAFNREPSESILVSAIVPVFSIISITSITAAHKTRLFSNEARGAAILFGFAILVCVPLAILINYEQSLLRLLCLVLATLVCAAMHAVNFLYISCLPRNFARYGRAATASGFCNACTYIGAAVSMYGIPAVADKMGWSATVVTWIFIGAIGSICSLLAFKKYTKFTTQ